MKLSSSFISRDSLAKKIAKRNQERIAEYTTVSSAFKPEDVKLIKENIDSIARFAEKNKVNIEFEPTASSKGIAKMNLYNRGAKLMNTFDTMTSEDMVLVPVTELAGSAKLPAGLSNKEELMDAIKSNSAQILYRGH